MDEFYPRRPWHVWLPELSFAAIVAVVAMPLVLGTFGGAILVLIFLPFIRCLRTGFLWPKYYRDPSSRRVAIVGAGWSGLAIAARFREVGVAFQGFEAAEDVGGTWNPQRHYTGLRLHTPAYGASFALCPFPSEDETPSTPDERPNGAEMHAYIRRFAEEHELLRYFTFGARVRSIIYDAKAHEAHLHVTYSDATEQAPSPRAEAWGPFDLIVYASVAAEPRVPQLPGRFDGIVCHVCRVSDALVASLAEQQRRVVVVGAGELALSRTPTQRRRLPPSLLPLRACGR